MHGCEQINYIAQYSPTIMNCLRPVAMFVEYCITHAYSLASCLLMFDNERDNISSHILLIALVFEKLYLTIRSNGSESTMLNHMTLNIENHIWRTSSPGILTDGRQTVDSEN
jgi:hypothetical protein